jgi:hypothetical protein
MKKLLLVILVVFLSNCTNPPSIIPEIDIFLITDFSKYSEQGFLFTPLEYKGDYESIGMVTKVFYPKANFVDNTKQTDKYKKVKYQNKETKEIISGRLILERFGKVYIDVNGEQKDYRLDDLILITNEEIFQPKVKGQSLISYWNQNDIDPEYLIDSIYEECIGMGANAFTMMKTNPILKSYHFPPQSPFEITGLEVSGFAIKRKGAFK